LADGLFYGAARYFTGSTLLPILFHSLGNLYAVYERIVG
jgi:membrane protease YdiL (CAAX protease family)